MASRTWIFAALAGWGSIVGAGPAAYSHDGVLAHWSFDEPFGASYLDSSGQSRHAAAAGDRTLSLRRVPGVHGCALSLGGQHRIEVDRGVLAGSLPEITLSAWVLPTDLREYRDIFRKEDGEKRVLFSFQGDGSILSLGLNVGGYVECDARVDPASVLDGRWHHAAATFDGQRFRVYLDGVEIGSLERSGTISCGGAAPACIGSSNGAECFQGLLDDLQVLGVALEAREVSDLYEEGLSAIAESSQPMRSGEPTVDRPLIAWWTFNERSAGAPIHDLAASGEDTKVLPQGPVLRGRGVHGGALELIGEHRLESWIGPALRSPNRISVSAWVRPRELEGFREILRQECARRLLFSFQEGGTILSLGLNVGGYIECDAPVDPGKLMDGSWHHCAGTFDGQWFRVFLDGVEVGSLRRSGGLSVDREAPAFIGSSSGSGEHFQGGLDDLRIYADSLSAEDVGSLYRYGLEAEAQSTAKADEAADAAYRRDSEFAATLAGLKLRISKGEMPLDGDIADALARRLAHDFPDECDAFRRYVGVSPVECLVRPGDSLEREMAGRLVDLLLEYRPLTDDQRQHQSPEELREWKEADAIAARLDHAVRGGRDEGAFAEWIRIILDAGPRIRFRPVLHEAVAPYVEPSTPATRDLTREEAREALRLDWLHQASGRPTPQRIRDEIRWARELAARIAEDHDGAVDLSRASLALAALEARASELPTDDAELYFEVRGVKRSIQLQNPVVDFDRVLLVDAPYPRGSEWRHETRHRLGYMAVPGGRLLVLEGLGPGGHLTQLLPQAPLHGSFWRPDVSWDATRALVCFKPHNEKSFHLYEIGLDGSNPRQLTEGPFDDLDPIYLPDEKHIVFSTTRSHTYVRCMPPTNAFVLARCDRDGNDIYLISRNNEPDYLPSVMHDGRILYTRWEYTDKPLWRAQKLWTANPDGTYVSMFWGNQSVWPDLVKDARVIPGSHRVMVTGSAHHDWFSGSVGIVDVARGLNFPDGIHKVTADVPWPECGNGPVDPVESIAYHSSGDYPAYYSPYPLGEKDFLVSAMRGGKFLLYLMDVDGNRELIYEGAHNVLHAIPIRARARPPALADRVAWPSREQRDSPQDGVLFSADVYEGAPEALRGSARFLRILHIEPKTYTYWYKRPYISTGPVVSAVQSEGVKRILGTVPIEADGSVAFRAPAGTAIHFQLLDGEYRALQTMRSFTGVMPGEQRGCLGCHALHSRAPARFEETQAFQSGPRAITAPPWGNDTVGYMRYVQPVLDRHCGSCHQTEGKAREALDLTVRPAFDVFTEPYWTLIGRPTWGRPYERPVGIGPGLGIAGMLMVEGYGTLDPAAYRTPEPMTSLSYRSPLVEMASSGRHHDVRVNAIELRRLIAWIDAMCPYVGDEEIREIPDPTFQGVEWLSVRPRIRTAPRIIRPGPVD